MKLYLTALFILYVCMYNSASPVRKRSTTNGRSPCGSNGGPQTREFVGSITPSDLSEVSRRVLIKLQKLEKQVVNLKTKYADVRINDSDILARLNNNTTVVLEGFQHISNLDSSEDVWTRLPKDYRKLGKSRAFLTLMHRKEEEPTFKRQINAMRNELKGVLCELYTLLKSRDITLNPLSTILTIANAYREDMAQSHRNNLSYVILRDILGNMRNEIAYFNTL